MGAFDHMARGYLISDIITIFGTYDVVISDVSMPGDISGVDLAELIEERYPHIRVILVSGHARAQLPPIPPAARFLPKPYRLAQLVELLQEAPLRGAWRA